MTPLRRLLPILFVVALASAGVRWVNNLRLAEVPERGGRAAWVSTDPDSLYHMRRLERALDEGGNVSALDPLLDHPTRDGAPIPWPSAYTRVLWSLAAPFSPPEGRARDRFVEHLTASMPLVWAALTSLLVALAAGRLAGRAAALVAGLTHAFTFASMRYSFLGMGDHHAWTSLLHVAWLTAATEGLARRSRPRAAAAWGAVAGLCAGVSLASWVPTLIPLALFQLTLLALLLRRAGRLPRGLVPFTAAFHGMALVVVVPEVLASPWANADLINLSPVHALSLALGLAGAVAVQLRPAAGRRLALGLPLAALFAGVVYQADIAVAWSWLSARDPFMAHIHESQPLGGDALRWLGYGALLLPVAWLLCLRRDADERWPWLVALPALVAMAFLQRRFAEGLAGPAAVVLAVGLCRFPWCERRRALVGLGVLAVAAHPGVVRTTWNRSVHGVLWFESDKLARERDLRAACRWLREQPQAGAVLAQWDQGHLIEWVARRPTLASNFGGYLGERWLDPWRVLTAADEDGVQDVLAERDVRFVLLASDWMRNRVPMSGMNPDLDTCLAARLLPRGEPGRDPALDDLGTLRLVHRVPGAWVHEHVAGALVVGTGEPGETLRVSLTVRLDGHPVEWSAASKVGDDGLARLRVPHATDAAAGDSLPTGPARWSLGARRGEVDLTEEGVTSGARVVLP
jgi:hypothetical protein